MIAGLGYTFIERFERLQKVNVIGIVTVIILFVSIILFALINFNLLKKNYPDKNLSVAKLDLYNTLLVFYCLTALITTALYFYHIYETIASYKNGIKDETGLDVLIGMTLFMFSIFYILIQSLKLKKLISKNAQLKVLDIENNENDILSSIHLEM